MYHTPSYISTKVYLSCYFYKHKTRHFYIKFTVIIKVSNSHFWTCFSVLAEFYYPKLWTLKTFVDFSITSLNILWINMITFMSSFLLYDFFKNIITYKKLYKLVSSLKNILVKFSRLKQKKTLYLFKSTDVKASC